MTADQAVDQHLRAVFDALVRAIYVTKQLVWSAPGDKRDQLRDLLAFLVEQSQLVDEAEARIGGRAEAMASPSSHERRNLLGDVSNDVQVALALYAERVAELASDFRRRASAIGGGQEAELLLEITEGLQARVLGLHEETS